MPQRIQRRRTKGWRLPDNAVIVDRTSRWGNPAAIGLWVSVGPTWRTARRCTTSTVIRSNRDAALYFGMALRYGGLVVEGAENVKQAIALPSHDEIREQLGGRDLACWCALDEPCHADVLLEIANPGHLPPRRPPG